MKLIAKLKSENTTSVVKELNLYDLENGEFRIQLLTNSIDAAEKLNNKLIAILRISDAEEAGEENKLNFVTEFLENTVIITGNIHNAVLALKAHKILDSQIIYHFDDQDEVEIMQCLNKTKRIQIQGFYDNSVEKRGSKKIAVLSSSDDDDLNSVIESEEVFCQKLGALSLEKQITILERLSNHLSVLGHECNFKNINPQKGYTI